MSASYTAVGWNRQKKYYDWLMAGFCSLYLLLFIAVTAISNPDYTFETALIRSTSTLALLLLHVILSIGPLCRLNNKFLPLLYNRRHMGVTMFTIALVHGSFSIFQFHALGNVNPLVSVFVSNTNFTSISAFPFQALGFLALLIFFLMAITSQLRASAALGEIWLSTWQDAGLLKPSAVKPVVATLEQHLVIRAHAFLGALRLLGVEDLVELQILAVGDRGAFAFFTHGGKSCPQINAD